MNMTTEQAMVLEGLEVSISALVQSINGLMKKEETLTNAGLTGSALDTRQVVEKLYMLRNELVLILNEQKKQRTQWA